MCFSANASFAASAIVAVGGIVSLKKVETRKQIMFASIPLIFAIQQLMEAFVWLSLTHPESSHWHRLPEASFLFVAQVIWPLWVPLSILCIEKDPKRRMALKILVGISIVVAPLQAYRLIFLPFDAEITPKHIHYSLDFSFRYFALALNVFYFLTTIGPPFFSKVKGMLTLGLLNITSFLITVILFEKNVISVWCFFAALISWQVVMIIKDQNVHTEFKTHAME
ncbi:MAG: DUF6629 family protein [Chryseolinea sp.]